MRKMQSTTVSSSQNSASLSSSSSIGDTDYGVQNYLPAVLAHRKAAQVGSIDLHFTKLPDGRYRYTYTVDWKENVKDVLTATRQESDFSQMLTLDRVDQLSNRSSCRSTASSKPFKSCARKAYPSSKQPKFWRQHRQPPPSTQQQLSFSPSYGTSSSSFRCNNDQQCVEAQQPKLIRCDGPCLRKVDVHELKLMGLCEHVACKACLENAPRIEAIYGGLGCPNSKCYLLDLASICPDKEQRLATIRRAYAVKSPSNTTAPSSSTITFSTKMSIKHKK